MCGVQESDVTKVVALGGGPLCCGSLATPSTTPRRPLHIRRSGAYHWLNMRGDFGDFVPGHFRAAFSLVLGHLRVVEYLVHLTARGEHEEEEVVWTTATGHRDSSSASLSPPPPARQSPQDFTATSGDRQSPLHACALKGFEDVAEFLLRSSHAEVTLASASGALPLHWASQAGHAPLAEPWLTELDHIDFSICGSGLEGPLSNSLENIPGCCNNLRNAVCSYGRAERGNGASCKRIGLGFCAPF